MGRHSEYTSEIALEICECIARGMSLRVIAEIPGMPCPATVCKWLIENKDFTEQYARARERQADFYAAEIIQIADDGLNDSYVDEDGRSRTDHDVVARSRLRVDARKWYASKLAPKKYGERVETAHTGVIGVDKAPVESNRPAMTREEWLKTHGIDS